MITDEVRYDFESALNVLLSELAPIIGAEGVGRVFDAYNARRVAEVMDAWDD